MVNKKERLIKHVAIGWFSVLLTTKIKEGKIIKTSIIRIIITARFI
jgi:hypothetical protein